MKPHRDKPLLDELFPHIRKYEELANKHGITDVFQDNGGKLLQVLLVTGLVCLPGREGNDAKDPLTGKEYELKSVNINKTKGFSTHHHLNPTILKKYRSVEWVFATYCDIELQEIYLVQPEDLEGLFCAWEQTWHERNKNKLPGELKWDWNNPKIPVVHVRDVGQLIYGSPPPAVGRRRARQTNPDKPDLLDL